MSSEEKVRLEGGQPGQQEKLLAQDAAKNLNPYIDGKNLEGRLTIALLFAVIAVTIGGSFQFGYHIGNVNAPGGLITTWYQESYYNLHGKNLTYEDAELQWSISVGIFAVGGMAGGLLSGWLADKMGRKGALLFNNLFAFIAAAFLSFAKRSNVFYFITVGRLVIGFCCGLSSGLVPMYLTEVSPINLRGTLGSVHQLMVTISILFAQILGLRQLLGNEDWWPVIFAFTIVPAIFQLVTLPLCPESPKYNLIVKANIDQAERDLKKLRGKPDVSQELDIIKDEAAAAQNQTKTGILDMFSPTLRWPMTIAIMMMLSQQFSGINAAMFYSTTIFKRAGLTGDWPIYATIAMGAINVAQTVVSLWLVDHPKFGRRSLHLTGLIGMLVSSLLIVISMILANPDKDGVPERQWASYLSILFVLTFVISFATGPGSIPWFFVSEIFPSSARGSANSIAVMANWTANFIVGVSFLPINNLLGQYTFLVFVVLLAFFIFFTYKFVPETKGKTVEEINRELSRNRT